MAQKRKKRRPVLEKRTDGYYENGKKLDRRDYACHFNCQHGWMLISGITGYIHPLDSGRRPI